MDVVAEGLLVLDLGDLVLDLVDVVLFLLGHPEEVLKEGDVVLLVQGRVVGVGQLLEEGLVLLGEGEELFLEGVLDGREVVSLQGVLEGADVEYEVVVEVVVLFLVARRGYEWMGVYF